MMRKVIFVLLLLGAHLNLSALVPLQVGDVPPPWWVGGRLLWPFGMETRTLIAPGDTLNTVTPLLAILSALCFLLVALALLRRVTPQGWVPWLLVAGVVFSVGLQVIWFSGWALLPLLVDGLLLWALFSQHVPAGNFHTQASGR